MKTKVQTVNYPAGFTSKDIVSYGTAGFVFLDRSSNTVVKSPRSEAEQPLVDVERNIYERFAQHGGHEGLLHYYGPYETGIRLEYAANDGILPYIKEHDGYIGLKQRLEWCEEISATLSFIHSNNVIHGDFKCNHILLDHALRTKVADFGGSSLDGSELGVVVTASHRKAGDLKSREGDVFALGSTLYEVMTGRAPYDGCTEEEIERSIGNSKFPDTKALTQ